MELCQMVLDICAQRPTYEEFFGLLDRQLCLLKKEYVEYFEKVFQDQYEIIHSLENVQLRNVAKLVAHLLTIPCRRLRPLDPAGFCRKEAGKSSDPAGKQRK